MAPINVIRYYGERNVPQDVRRRRMLSMQTMRRVGTPVLVKHMYNDEDRENSIAEHSPNWDDVYKQVSQDDLLSHGIGLVSVEKSANEWISPAGEIVVNTVSPGAGYRPAPMYRGFGPGYLTYVILPDVAEDEYRMTESGVLIRTQTATAQMGWYPEVNDNDLLIQVVLDRNENIVAAKERYQLKQTSPISIRGLDRKGRREFTEDTGNQHVVNQTFQLTLVPANNYLYAVETDR